MALAFAERWVRTVREDCLDHVIVLSRRHLERTLSESSSTTTEVDLTAEFNSLPRPASRAISGSAVVQHDLLGGLIHEYELVA